MLAKLTKNQGTALLVLKGPIDESANLPKVELDGVKDIIVDFKEVEYINSIGISKWISWAQEFNKNYPAARMVLRNCTVGITKQLNAVEGFLPANARVLSFEVPYYCEDCGQNRVVLYQEGQQYRFSAATGKPEFSHPSVQCTRCRVIMDLDVVERTYFTFLKDSVLNKVA